MSKRPDPRDAGSRGVVRARPPGGWLIGCISPLVPSKHRAEWRSEWLAELEHARADLRESGVGAWRIALALNARALGALRDAHWLARNEGGPVMRGSDVRGALRVIRRRPGFAAAVVFTVAAGIGAATAIFSVVDCLLLRPIPFSEPDRLVEVMVERGDYASPYMDSETFPVWHARHDVFEQVRAHAGRAVTLTGRGEPRLLRAERVEPGFLSMLGLRPALGRAFLPEDATPGRDDVVLLGDALWRSAFAADPAIVDSTIRLDGRLYTVVGVLPPVLRVLPRGQVSVMVPLVDTARSGVTLLARLRPNTTLATATARLARVSDLLEAERPRDGGWDLRLVPLQNRHGQGVREGLFVLAGAVALLLAIACANAAGLLLVRGAGRQQEFAIRRALGGSRASLVALMLAESLGLALLAGLCGVILAWWSVRALLRFIPPDLLGFSYTTVQVDARVLGFALLATLLTGLVFGLVPSLQASRASRSLASAGRGATSSREQRALRGGLVVAELALAVILLAGAGWLGHSLLRLIAVDPGFEPDGLVVASLSLPSNRYETRDARIAFRQRLVEMLRAAPAVRGVSQSLGGVPPNSNISFGLRLETADGRVPQQQPELLPNANVDTAFFPVMGIPILEGRSFRIGDATADGGAVIVDRDLARFLWPDGRAVGQRFRLDAESPWLTVVGVAGSVQLGGPGGQYGEFELYYPSQAPSGRYFTVAVRVRGEAATSIASLRRAIRSVDPDLVIEALQTANERYREALALPRFLLRIMAAFAVVALLLASVGMYALISYDVARRTREIGVRVALGARGGRIVRDVFASGMLLVGSGLVLGIGGAIALGRLARGVIFGIAPADPLTLVIATIILVAACALALVLPARRAAAVDPMEALRIE